MGEVSNLFREVRVLCWIGTHAKTHHSKAMHAKATWGRHCNAFLVVSETDDPSVPTVQVDAPGDRNGLWAKTVKAFTLIGTQHLNDFDWVLKADDDSFVILENLRRMLLPHDPDDALLFGCHYMRPKFADMDHMTGSGYVLSRQSVRLLVQRVFSNELKACRPPTFKDDEDVLISECLRALGVQFGDSRDARGRPRFSHNPVEMSLGKLPEYHYQASVWPIQKDFERCCSDRPVTFHHMSADQLYLMEYLVYHLNPAPATDLAKNPPF